MDLLFFTSMLLSFALASGVGQVIASRHFPIPDPARRIGCIDGLRGYLALSVMIHHFDIWTNVTHRAAPWGSSSALWLANLGPGGVALFFMTTGLVFYSRVAKGARAVDWQGTYLSRIFRILPLQLVTLAVALVIALVMAGGLHAPGATLRSLAMWATSYAEPPLFGYADAGLTNAKVLWSLWYEWIFYFAVLPIMALARDAARGRLPRWVLPLSLLVVGLILGPRMKYPAVLFYVPLFAAGMIAYELRDRPAIARRLASAPAAIVSGVALIASMLLAHGPFALPQLLAYALFFACVACGNRFGGLLATRGSLVLGECSFGIYLIHGIVLFLLFTTLGAGRLAQPWLLATLPAAAVVAVLLSALAHLTIERPMIRVGRRLAGKRRPKTAIEQAVLDVAP